MYSVGVGLPDKIENAKTTTTTTTITQTNKQTNPEQGGSWERPNTKHNEEKKICLLETQCQKYFVIFSFQYFPSVVFIIGCITHSRLIFSELMLQLSALTIISRRYTESTRINSWLPEQQQENYNPSQKMCVVV